MAHSMGGLDCRHLITHVRPTEYVPLSLTSISTPHHGSPFMDWCAVSLVPFMLPTDENQTRPAISRPRTPTIRAREPRTRNTARVGFDRRTQCIRETRHGVPSIAIYPPFLVHHPPSFAHRLARIRQLDHLLPKRRVQPVDAR